ncbi:uncharacterized protein I206_106394 [Kwoniella pini CBS 10737]|uniref:Dityrosine transporter n=1 Tax=Kwoniella pini CBS 10737 TaxID=1296096 RepID=A0A1B9HU66_9TREE|nr:dityrosine transporter [Kwoniella pini CBS 10737]OCF46811.1 dityrosine transporter [Kwoniella pini CBS 10737]
MSIDQSLNSNTNINLNSDSPSSSTSTLHSSNQIHYNNNNKNIEKMLNSSSSNEHDIKSKDYGINDKVEELNTKLPIEVEIEIEEEFSKPPSFISIQNNLILNSEREIQLNSNEKNIDSSNLTITKEKEIELIDGRPKDVYDRFTKSQKNRILAIVSYSAIIAPMTSSIFLPSIPQMAEQLNTTAEIINYTVAVFIIIIGIAPVFWSPFAGFYGRRPVYLASMPIMVISSIGVALSKNVGSLTGTRIIQGIGSSCFLSVGAGSIGDIFRPTERSRGMSMFYMVALLGPAISPALAGIFTEYTSAGWRSCQYFLGGMGALSVFAVFFFLPETSHPPLPHDLLKKEQNKKFVWYFCNPLSSLGLLRWPNILLATFISSVAMIDTYVILVPLSSVFKERYKLHNLAIVGSLYLSSGAGNILGSKLIGPWADKVVIKQIAKRGYRRPEDRLKTGYLGAFILMPLSALGYGWLVEYGAGGIAPPLVMVFLNGLSLMFVVAPLNTYLVDAMQSRSAEVIAVNNCIRYIFSAAASACVLPIANSIGWGLTLTICTILTWISAIALMLLYKYGDKWREKSNLKYCINVNVKKEEKEEEETIEIKGKDEESNISSNNQNNQIIRKSNEDEINDEHPIELEKIKNNTTTRPSHIKRQNSNNKNKKELPNVEQVLKRTISLSGASVHGGG